MDTQQQEYVSTGDVVPFHFVFDYLEPNELLKVATVCKRWKDLSYHNSVWKRHCRPEWDDEGKKEVDYRVMYRENSVWHYLDGETPAAKENIPFFIHGAYFSGRQSLARRIAAPRKIEKEIKLEPSIEIDYDYFNWETTENAKGRKDIVNESTPWGSEQLGQNVNFVKIGSNTVKFDVGYNYPEIEMRSRMEIESVSSSRTQSEEYKSKGFKGAFLLYDITAPWSDKRMDHALDELHGLVGKVPVVLLGNKLDLAAECRAVDLETAKKWAAKHNIHNVLEVSCKSGTHLDRALLMLYRHIKQHDAHQPKHPETEGFFAKIKSIFSSSSSSKA